jgi:subtilisin family serine protease
MRIASPAALPTAPALSPKFAPKLLRGLVAASRALAWTMLSASVALSSPAALAQAAPAALPPKAKARVPGETVYYFNGDVREELVLVSDELRLTLPASRVSMSLDDLKALSPAIVDARPFQAALHRVDVKLSTGSRSRAELEDEARAIKAVLGPGAEVQAIFYPPFAAARPANVKLSPTRTLTAQLKPSASLDALLQAHGLEVVESMDWMPRAYLLRAQADSLLAAVDAANALRESGLTEFATPEVETLLSTRFVPNDPLYINQWHLHNTGINGPGGIAGNDVNAEVAWDIATGAGVNIGVIDDGVDMDHPDLIANIKTNLSVDIVDGDGDPNPGIFDGHGTAVAGLAAATGNNGIGVAGVAFEAGIGAIRLITDSPITAQQIAKAERFQANVTGGIDIYNNSWGPAADNPSFGFLRALEPIEAGAFELGVQTGRSGRGSIFLFSAGNGNCEGADVNRNGLANSRYTIAVAASGSRGEHTYYSTPGAAILVNAPVSSGSCEFGDAQATTSTDVVGPRGFVTGDYTNIFNGTSAASPIVAGAVALMLEVRPDLTWRDVQHILVRTAYDNDFEHSGWIANGAGFTFNHLYGHGRVDAGAAVKTARTWTLVPASQPAATASASTQLSIPDFSGAGASQTLTLTTHPQFVAEHVELTANIAHTFRGDLEIVLVSPSGTNSVMMKANNDPSDNYSNWTMMSTACWGENPNGVWTLRLFDVFPGDTGALQSWTLTVHGYLGPPTDDAIVARLLGESSAELVGADLNQNGRLDVGDAMRARSME